MYVVTLLHCFKFPSELLHTQPPNEEIHPPESK